MIYVICVAWCDSVIACIPYFQETFDKVTDLEAKVKIFTSAKDMKSAEKTTYTADLETFEKDLDTLKTGPMLALAFCNTQ